MDIDVDIDLDLGIDMDHMDVGLHMSYIIWDWPTALRFGASK